MHPRTLETQPACQSGNPSRILLRDNKLQRRPARTVAGCCGDCSKIDQMAVRNLVAFDVVVPHVQRGLLARNEIGFRVTAHGPGETELAPPVVGCGSYYPKFGRWNRRIPRNTQRADGYTTTQPYKMSSSWMVEVFPFILICDIRVICGSSISVFGMIHSDQAPWTLRLTCISFVSW